MWLCNVYLHTMYVYVLVKKKHPFPLLPYVFPLSLGAYVPEHPADLPLHCTPSEVSRAEVNRVTSLDLRMAGARSGIRRSPRHARRRNECGVFSLTSTLTTCFGCSLTCFSLCSCHCVAMKEGERGGYNGHVLLCSKRKEKHG